MNCPQKDREVNFGAGFFDWDIERQGIYTFFRFTQNFLKKGGAKYEEVFVQIEKTVLGIVGGVLRIKRKNDQKSRLEKQRGYKIETYPTDIQRGQKKTAEISYEY